ncbi:hypothetical protein KQI86_07785 [Clostridium sp. MSJ-11]|uniref:Uncharacterized protein n=1 Tax=Clostridium mobile TaxID=2841512 RepID=A0ABS6EGR2_9CLOT|nr:hypothetical protein [Clostridium mobile]MBU5484228.1 hypothetical protein [Clostridium mobile]
MGNYNDFLMDKERELTSINPIDISGNYIEKIIREYLIYSCSNTIGATFEKFFLERLFDEKLLVTLFQILLDESENYSNDARYGAAFFISKFDERILKKYKDKLIYVQNYDIYSLRPFAKEDLPHWLNFE